MTEETAKTLNCPACGAPLDFDGSSAVIRCKFCRNVSFVPGVLPAQAAAPNLALNEIRRLAKRGDLLEAVKQYRALFDVGLKEAKDAVDALQAGRLAEAPAAAASARAPEELTQALEEVQRLLGQGNKIEAIKIYRVTYDVSLARAKYAVEQIEAGQTSQPEAGFPVRSAPAAGSRSSSPDRTGGLVGCVIVAAILLFVGGILAFAMTSPGGPFSQRYFTTGPAILVPSESDASPDVAALFYNPDNDTHVIGLLDGTTGKFRWRAEPLSGDGYADAIARGPDLVYAANEAELLAYHRSDGSQAWQARMPDRLNYGESTLLVAGDRVLTSTVDQSLQAYDAATGVLVWSRRLSGYDRTLRLVGGSLLVVDTTGDSYDYSLIFLDPEDGSEQRALTPSCQYDEYSSDTIDPSSGLIYDPAANAIYLIFNSSPGCVQRLDLASGQTGWQSLADDSFDTSPDAHQMMLTDDTLYFGSGNLLLAVDLATGRLRTLLSNEDYAFVPLAETGERLIVRARRTRGTQRFELWGLEGSTGDPIWQLDLEGGEPIDPPDEMSGLIDDTDTGWTWRLVPAGLVLVKFRGGPNQILLDTFDPADGTSLGEQVIPLKRVSGDFYSIPTVIGWQENVAYLALETDVYALDAAAGKLDLIH